MRAVIPVAAAVLLLYTFGIGGAWADTPVDKRDSSNSPRGNSARHAAWMKHHSLYLYTWCGLAPDNNGPGNDYIATIDANPVSTTFGQVVNTADSPYKGTQAHHIGVDVAQNWLGAGGLVSFLSGAPDIMMFNIKDAANPVYSHGFTAKQGACTDEFVPLTEGGFAITNMCNRTGNAGGGIAILDPKMQTLQEYTGSISNSAESSTFNPHGIDIDLASNRAVTCDFVEIASVVKDANGNATAKFRHTIRIWDWQQKTVIKTIDVGTRANGLMDVRRVPNSQGLFWTSNGLGQILLVDAVAGKVAEDPVYCLQPDCKGQPGVCIVSNTFASGTRMLLASYATNTVRLLDTTNPGKLIELDRYTMELGGHVVRYHEPTGIAAVSTYFVNQPGTVVTYPSDQRVYLLQVVSENGGRYNKLKLLKWVDFKTAVPSKGSSNCHGLAINSVPVRGKSTRQNLG